jgi:predicted SAM-dependent methyltransferase
MKQAKINLGCGRNLIEGWINIDNSPSAVLAKIPLLKAALFHIGLIGTSTRSTEWSKGIFWHDVTRGLPYADNTVDKIYSSHMLEHMDRHAGERVIGECFRVLRPGGIFRLVVPDLVFHARRYLRRVTNAASVDREPHDDFLWNIYGAYLSPRRKGAYHRYMYDWPTLRLLLQEAGFHNLVYQSYQVSLDPELALLDNRPEESLHIDALK